MPLADLAELGPPKPPAANQRELFAITEIQTGFRFVLHSDLLAEMASNDFHLFSYGFFGSPHGPGSHVSEIRCGGGGSFPAKVRGLHMRDWSDDRAAFTIYDATLNGTSCKGSATSMRDVDAKAVWPSVVYAFRSTEGPSGRPSVSLVAPAASWIAASVLPHAQVKPDLGSFTYVALPIEPGITKSVAMELSESAIDAFHGGTPEASENAGGEPPPMGTVIARVIIEVDSENLTTTVQSLSTSSILNKRMNIDASSNCKRVD
jgi:hypothetical protein